MLPNKCFHFSVLYLVICNIIVSDHHAKPLLKQVSGHLASPEQGKVSFGFGEICTLLTFSKSSDRNPLKIKMYR